MTYNFNKNIL